MNNRLLTLLVILPALAAGCGQRAQAPDGSLRFAVGADITTLDPMLSNDVASGEICALIFDGLVRFDGNLDVVPCLAESWELEDRGRTYVFKLKKGVRFSDGTRLSAFDVKRSFERVMRPRGLSSRRWLFEPVAGAAAFHAGRTGGITGISVPDSNTVAITLEQPDYLFLQFLAMPAAAVVPADLAVRRGPEFARQPVGSGPWQLDRWLQNDRLELVPNPHYHGSPPRLKRVVYRIIPEAMTVTSEFEVGNLDVMKIPDAEFLRWTGDPQWEHRIIKRQKLAVTYIGLNNAKKPFNDARVRRAINYAVDTDAILASVLEGRGIPSRGPVPPVLLKRTGSAENRYAYDPARARALLKEAGLDKGFAMEIWQRHNPETGRILEVVQAYLAEVGIKVSLVTRDWSSLKQAVNKGKPDAFYLDWYADYPDAENFLFPLFHSANTGGAGNRARYRSSVCDSLLGLARQTGAAAERNRLYVRISDLVYNDAPWLFLWHPAGYRVSQPWVDDYMPAPIFNGNKLVRPGIVSPDPGS